MVKVEGRDVQTAWIDSKHALRRQLGIAVLAVHFGCVMIVASALSFAVAAAVTPPLSPVPWANVRTAMSEPICVLVHTASDGREDHSAVVGVREYCKLPPASTPLERAVDKAYESTLRLTVSVHPKGLNAAYENGLATGERTRRAREAYLASEDFLSAVVPRLRDAMSAYGLRCLGCPEFAPRTVRYITWDEFAPYLAAYIWPDPVRTPKDADGKPVGRPKFSFHVCGGLNGIGEMKNPDLLLVRAGFVVAYGNKELLQSAGEHFGETLNEPEFLKLEDDEARSQYLRDHVPLATVKDPTARAAACRALAEVSADLGLDVSECADAPAADRDKR